MNEDFYSVSQLNNFIRDCIQAGFPQPVWVCGEIQGYNRQRGKNHVFFQLVEKDPKAQTQKATIDLVIWAGKKNDIREILHSAQESFELCDDIEVKFLCRVDFYSPHGRVRLSVESIDPFFTLGKLAQDKQKLIAKLKESGVLEKNKLKELAVAPVSLGLITSDDSAAYNDFIAELARSGYGFKVYLRNCLMQGKRAEKDVCQAIDELSRIKALDAIIITRGGGSLAELSCFDSEAIAVKIAEAPLPLLSGIGHEINITVTDLAAHTHTKTPTAIAQYLINRVEAFISRLDELMDIIIEGSHSIMEREKKRLKSGAYHLQSQTQLFLKEHNMHLVRLSEMVRSRPNDMIKQQNTRLKIIQDSLNKNAIGRIHGEKRKLSEYVRTITAYDPLKTLRRGFSITRAQTGRALKGIDEIEVGESIVTQLAEGILESDVSKKKKE